jgi:cytochrome c oxidase subunit 4
MSTTETDPHEARHEAEHEAHEIVSAGPRHHGGLSDIGYVWVALILGALTALEVSTYYFDFGPFFIPLLLTLMTIKFFLVILFFMHLRFESKIYGFMFYTGLGLALVVYIAALATFQFFL